MEADLKFDSECKATLQAKQREGIEVYAPVLGNFMRQCQKEYKDNVPNFEIRWKGLLQAARGFDPRKRCFSDSELLHFPELLILKQKGKKDEFNYYMLRYRLEEANGSEKEKQMLIHEIERKKHAMSSQ